jgi:hypothetical protein
VTQEMTSFVLRFVREVSEEQGARWRGLIQHVQSGAERNFATFPEAVQFMQGRVLQHTTQALEEAGRMEDKNLLLEMAKMWGDLAPQMAQVWATTVAQIVEQSAAFRSELDQAVATALKAWRPPTSADQAAFIDDLARLNAHIDHLVTRITALEEKLAAQQPVNDVTSE